MKAGLRFADAITTVSPTYAHEIRGAEQGCGLDGLLRSRSAQLHGILSGVDGACGTPATDGYLAKTYDADRPEGRAACKAALQRRMAWPRTRRRRSSPSSAA